MVTRCFQLAAILFCVVGLHAATAPQAAAQINGATGDSRSPRQLQRPMRNLGDVFNNATKSYSDSARTVSNEVPVRSSIRVQGGEFVDAQNQAYEGAGGEYIEYDGEYGEYFEEGSAYGGAFYARGEYLLWWLGGDRYPALVTTSPNGTPRADAGVLGESDTSILFGDDTINDGSRNGTRVVMGVCLTPVTRLEGDWFTLGSNGAVYSAASTGNPILARPFFNLATGVEDANVIAFPGELEGGLHMAADTQFMGAGLHIARNLTYCDADDGCGYRRWDFVYGFRWLGLYDDFDAYSDSTVTGGGVTPIGTMISIHDSFVTSNNFYGANIGVTREQNRGRWFLTTSARLGIGATRQRMKIEGSTTALVPGGAEQHFDGGLLALPTNMGNYSRNEFGLVPHLQLEVAYMLTERMRWTFGYDLLYWSNVVRPGEQIDLFVNPSQASEQPLVGTPGPLFPFKSSDLWVQGISTGLEIQF